MEQEGMINENQRRRHEVSKRPFKSTKKHPMTWVTYRPPFKAENGMVLDGFGYVVAQFQPNEQILVGRTTGMDAADALACALNEYATGGTEE